LIFGVLMPLSAIFQLYHGDQFLVVEEAGVPEDGLHQEMKKDCKNFLKETEKIRKNYEEKFGHILKHLRNQNNCNKISLTLVFSFIYIM
jgi:hypothetical protein